MGLRLIVTAFVLYATTAVDAEVQIEVRAGGHDRESCPVTLPVPASLKGENHFLLVRNDNGSEVPIQRLGPPNARRLVWMINERLGAGSKRRYTLSAASPRKQQRSVTCQDDGHRLILAVEGSPVLHFNHDTVEAPEGIDPVYRRSGYIHPVFTPQGKVVTGDFEKDHPHQHGVFFAWVNATFRGQPTDFWNQAKARGGIAFDRFRNRQISGPVFAQFTARLSHYAIIADQRIPVIEETYQVRVFHTKDPFLVEITSRQTAATDDPLVVNEYHYGGFALRGPSEWLLKPASDQNSEDRPRTGDFATSSGRTRQDGNHTRARWVEMHGPIGSQHAGIIALSAQNNFRAPQTVRLHPNKPYFCFAPMVLGAFAIEPHEVHSSRYRLVIHDGTPDADLAERMWQDLAHPPKVVTLSETGDDANNG